MILKLKDIAIGTLKPPMSKATKGGSDGKGNRWDNSQPISPVLSLIHSLFSGYDYSPESDDKNLRVPHHRTFDAPQVTHRNYMEYLAKCYNDHLGVVLTPDVVWYTLLCELALVIKADPQRYLQLFRPDQKPTPVTEDKFTVSKSMAKRLQEQTGVASPEVLQLLVQVQEEAKGRILSETTRKAVDGLAAIAARKPNDWQTWAQHILDEVRRSPKKGPVILSRGLARAYCIITAPPTKEYKESPAAMTLPLEATPTALFSDIARNIKRKRVDAENTTYNLDEAVEVLDKLLEVEEFEFTTQVKAARALWDKVAELLGVDLSVKMPGETKAKASATNAMAFGPQAALAAHMAAMRCYADLCTTIEAAVPPAEPVRVLKEPPQGGGSEDARLADGQGAGTWEKLEISVQSDTNGVLPLDAVIKRLKEHIGAPASILLPQFTTTLANSDLALAAALMDAASPYYSYSMFLCGIPVIDVRGSLDEWNALAGHWEALADLLDPYLEGELETQAWVVRVGKTLSDLAISVETQDVAGLSNIFRLEKCGSGSQVEVKGWWKELYLKKAPRPGYVGNYSTHVSRIDFIDKSDNNKPYEMFVGLFGSNMEGDFLVPRFDTLTFAKE